MPWTFAHPAAVLPFRKLGTVRLPLLGLVLGSIAPDLGYYVGRLDVATFAHSWLGVPLFCVPVTLVLALILVRWRRELTAPLPPPHRHVIDGLSAPEIDTLAGAAMLAAAALVGAMTHVIWDSFTHASGEAVKSISALRAPIGVYGGRTVFLYNVLQHGSTVIGVLVLAAAYWRWLRRSEAPPRSAPSIRRLPVVVWVAVVSIFVGAGIALWVWLPATSVSHLVVRTVVYSTTVFTALYVVLGILLVRAR